MNPAVLGGDPGEKVPRCRRVPRRTCFGEEAAAPGRDEAEGRDLGWFGNREDRRSTIGLRVPRG